MSGFLTSEKENHLVNLTCDPLTYTMGYPKCIESRQQEESISNHLCQCVKQNSGTASVNTDSQWSKQEACFAHEIQVWLPVTHNTSVTSGQCIQCSKGIARASAWQLSIKFCVIHEAMNRFKNLKIH